MRFLFFVLGVPMMIMSFFEAVDVIDFAQAITLSQDGHNIELSLSQQQELKEQIKTLFQGSHTLPALSVVFPDDFQALHSDGTFVTMHFGGVMEINDLPFDSLMFKVDANASGFNLMRANNGIFQGRCIYIDLNGKTMSEFSQYVDTLTASEALDSDLASENLNFQKQPENVENVAEKSEILEKSTNFNEATQNVEISTQQPQKASEELSVENSESAKENSTGARKLPRKIVELQKNPSATENE